VNGIEKELAITFIFLMIYLIEQKLGIIKLLLN